MIWKNSRGQKFHSGIGGTYPANNGDPQCDIDEEEDEEELGEDYDGTDDIISLMGWN